MGRESFGNNSIGSCTLRKLDLRILVTEILLLICCSAFGQTFNKRIDVSGDHQPETAFSIEHHQDGYLVVISTFTDIGVQGIGLQILSPLGDLMTETIIADSLYSQFPGSRNSSDRLNDGGYAIAGSAVFADSTKILITRLDDLGQLVWQTMMPNLSGEVEVGRALKETSDGGFVIAASYGSENGDSDALLVKTNNLGEEVWRSPWGFENSSDQFFQVTEIQGVGFAIGGWSESLGGDDLDMIIAQFDYDGEEMWSYAYPNTFDDVAAFVEVSADNDIIFCGQKASDAANGGRPVLGKLSSIGDELWSNQYGWQAALNMFRACKELNGGDIIGAGASVIPWVDNAGLLCKISASGDSLWYRNYYNIYADDCFLYDVIANEDGGFTACGWTLANSTQDLSQDAWVIRTDEHGCIIPGCHVGVNDLSEDQGGFLIGPNPLISGEHLNVFINSLNHNDLRLVVMDKLSKTVLAQDLPFNGATYAIDTDQLTPGVYEILLWSDFHFLGQKSFIVN